MRRNVSICAGGGMAHQDIAVALGISRNTLEKHFEAELSVGASQRRMEVLAAMHRAAKGGNVTAQKAYIAMTPTPSVPPVPEPEVGTKAPKLGKKEQADADAKTAAVGTEWGDLLPKAGTPLQ